MGKSCIKNIFYNYNNNYNIRFITNVPWNKKQKATYKEDFTNLF